MNCRIPDNDNRSFTVEDKVYVTGPNRSFTVEDKVYVTGPKLKFYLFPLTRPTLKKGSTQKKKFQFQSRVFFLKFHCNPRELSNVNIVNALYSLFLKFSALSHKSKQKQPALLQKTSKGHLKVKLNKIFEHKIVNIFFTISGRS